MAFMKRKGNLNDLSFSDQNVNIPSETPIIENVNKRSEKGETSIQNVNYLYEDIPKTMNQYTEPSMEAQTFNPSIPVIDALSIENRLFVPVKCKWLVALYDRYHYRGNEEKLLGMSDINWVSIHYRCLLECVIAISEMKEVPLSDLAELTNAFTFLISSSYFESLPSEYPYTKKIIALRKKLRDFWIEMRGEDWIQFRLKWDTKRELMLYRFELSMVFPRIGFDELQENFRKEGDKIRNKATSSL
jgi:hypothetical protein